MFTCYLTAVWTSVVLEIPLPIILGESFCNCLVQSKKALENNTERMF